ncbi:glycosyltransferase [Actinoallomurus spadix]|nr:glycosyltransferase [Actinoallomurus spadix]
MLAAILMARNPRHRGLYQRSRLQQSVPLVNFLCFGAGWSISVAFGGDPLLALVVAGCGGVAGVLTGRKLTDFWPAGSVFMVTIAVLCVLPIVWTTVFLRYIIEHGVSAETIFLVSVGAILYTVFLPSDLLAQLERWQIVLRCRWRRARSSVKPCPPGYAPMVSVQVPIHAEPPEIVIQTLNALSQLNYTNYEVLVIDNNTADEDLWRPVERHCAMLGPRFRFLHVEGITGAKAGALNWARPYMNPGTELVGVVDADYVVAPDWLTHAVGHFVDLRMGFVQYPHAYRDYESSVFRSMANAEYRGFFYSDMIGLDENRAGITVGTMSLIRLAALDKAGGWAEWCLTEDSELAIRIHACGYTSTYVERPYGWGLIPDTWSGYKKQRFRWTYGPVQELRRHAGLFRPGRRRIPSMLDLTQRIYHANHGVKNAIEGIRFAGLVLGPALLLSMIAHRDTWPLPLAWIVPLAAISIGRQALRWTLCRNILGFDIRDYVGWALASTALTYTIGQASLAALLGRKAIWRRTDKFRRIQPRFAALQSAAAEGVFAVVFLAFTVLSVTVLPMGILSVAIAYGFLTKSITFAAAPVLSYLSDREQRKSFGPPQNGSALSASDHASSIAGPGNTLASAGNY